MTENGIQIVTREVVQEILELLHDKVYRIVLYGSYARGEATAQSDVDFMIEGGIYEGMFGFVNVMEALKKAVDKNVDLVESRVVYEDNSRSGRRFRDHIERDKVLVYECDK